jgi:SAM-dependent MidA family methyltransferase
MAERWRDAMARALYGPDGFFVSGAAAPAGHFRTSVAASALFAEAMTHLVVRLDAVLGQPDPFTVVDMGTGRAELLSGLWSYAPESIRERLELVGVDLAPRPADLPDRIDWRREPPPGTVGLLIANEWLDNVPLDIAEADPDGVARYLLTDDTTGSLLSTEDSAWLSRWWPPGPGERAEIGAPRDAAWRAAVSTVERGAALAIDYGHLSGDRPKLGTLTGYRRGRQVPPVPHGDRDLTAHVAIDSLSPTGGWFSQCDALRALGVSGARPPLALAHTDPGAYLAALARAGEAAELTDPAGLGGHFWLLETVGLIAAEPLLGDPHTASAGSGIAYHGRCDRVP